MLYDYVPVVLYGCEIVSPVPFFQFRQICHEPNNSVCLGNDAQFRQPFAQEILLCFQNRSTATKSIDTAAGVIPGILPACPMVSGCTSRSFSITSLERPWIEVKSKEGGIFFDSNLLNLPASSICFCTYPSYLTRISTRASISGVSISGEGDSFFIALYFTSGRFSSLSRAMFSVNVDVPLDDNSTFSSADGLTLSLFSLFNSLSSTSFFLRKRSYTSLVTRPILYPFSRSRKSALSCLRSNRYSALEVNIR